jgi:hypothetical protein
LSPKLTWLEPGHPASDYSCPACGFWYQLKSQKSRKGFEQEATEETEIFFPGILRYLGLLLLKRSACYCTSAVANGFCREHFLNAKTPSRKVSECFS